MERKTPLYEKHVALGGKMVPFAGYLLPVQYPAGVITEHLAVREKAGLFDVSHMGELVFTGADALANLNRLLTNDFTGMADGRVRYSVMCYDDGGAVDDLIVYKFPGDRYFVVVNASNREKDRKWMKSRLEGDVKLEDISDSVAQLALQGPSAEEILRRLTGDIPEKYYTFVQGRVCGEDCIISRTGYTGESGFEIYIANCAAEKLWDELLSAGKDYGLIPCGLGARDTLRLEAGMPLYGHELSESIDPLESGLGFGVKMAKEDFIGKSGLEKRMPLSRKRVGLRVTGRGIVREGCALYCGGEKVGDSTSGTYCPYLGYPAAMAMVDIPHSADGTALEADVRGRRVECEVVPLPFYKRTK